MSAIPKELFGLKVEVVRSKRKTAALHIIGDEIQVRVPNRLRDGKIVIERFMELARVKFK